MTEGHNETHSQARPDQGPQSARDLDSAAAVFSGVRPRLFGIAYRMLGSATDAEDIVQEAWLRWQTYDRTAVNNPAAFLATTTTRLAINAAQTARARHETYVGPWLPEPVDTSADPTLGAERGEALEFAVLLLMEKLTPTERAAYVLRESFDFPYQQIASILELKEAAARQLVARARKHIRAGHRAPASPQEHRRLLAAFLDAAQSGDLEGLKDLLVADVVSYSDGGGKVRAARTPLFGRARVAQFAAGVVANLWSDFELTWIEANGQASVLVRRDNSIHALVAVTTSDHGINQVLWMRNPDKLATIAETRAAR